MDAPAEECNAAAAAAARVEALFRDLPGGYDVDKEAATYDDNLTYGEMATADLALMCQRVRQTRRSGATHVSAERRLICFRHRCRGTPSSTLWTSDRA